MPRVAHDCRTQALAPHILLRLEQKCLALNHTTYLYVYSQTAVERNLAAPHHGLAPYVQAHPEDNASRQIEHTARAKEREVGGCEVQFLAKVFLLKLEVFGGKEFSGEEAVPF
jgi:hypothetical protein